MPSLKDRDVTSPSESSARNAGGADSSSRQQPVALEVPLTVNGARPLEGSDKREPFSESTKTVLVFDNGAVIRLSFVVAPGQLLFLTNERTKKEIICQVVRSKAGASANGYVEVEFTEPISGFWGLRFPADRSALRSRTSLSEAESDTDEFLRSAMDTNATVTRKRVSAQPDSGTSGHDEHFKPELKSEERASSRADLLAESPADAPKLESNRLQERLSALFSAEQRSAPFERASSRAESGEHKALSDTTAKLFEMAEASAAKGTPETAPGSGSQPAKTLSSLANSSDAKSTLPREELKVPSWLQPLTRDASASAPSHEEQHKTERAALEKEDKPTAGERESKPLRKSKPPKAAPVLGTGLLGQSAAPAASHHSNKGLIVGVAAGLLAAAAGAAWYFQQPSSLVTNSVRSTLAPTAPAPALVPAPSAATSTESTATATSPQQAQPPSTAAETAPRSVPQTVQAKPGANAVPENASTTAPPRLTPQPAVISERIPNAAPATSDPAAAWPPGSAESAEPAPKKPSLGEAALTKPKLKRRAKSGGVAAPSLTDTPAVSAAASLGAGLVPESASQPAAPVPLTPPTPVGGDVKPARLLSSVSPVYPSIARSQRLAGDVRIDALIDSNGRVSSMKVISGPPLLHQAAMDALRQWKYQPATLNGSAVPMHLTVTLQFHLQ
jgi:TonB family protein